MSRRRRAILINTVLAAAVLAVLATTVVLVRGGSSAADTSQTRTVTAQTGTVSATVSASGALESVRQVAANFGTSGTVSTVKVEVGDHVSKGEVLATLATTDALSAVSLARTNLSAAYASLTKAKQGNTATDQQTGASTTTVDAAAVAQAKAQVAAAKESLADAETALANTTLTAPITGTVLSVTGIVGSTVSSGSAGSGATSQSTGTSSDFVTIANLNRMQVAVTFSESDIGSVKVGQAAAITFPAVADVTAKGRVVSIDPNPTTTNSVTTYGAVVRLREVPAKVRLGQTASVVITTATARDTVIVPTLAITTMGDRSLVTVVEDGVATPTEVTTGVAGTSYTQVVSGITAGTQIRLDLSETSDSDDSTSGSSSGRSNQGGGQ